MVSFRTVIGRLDHLPTTRYLLVPEKYVQKLGGLKTRVICTVENSVTYRSGLVALGDGDAYLPINKNQLEIIDAEEGDEVGIKLEKDPDKLGVDIPVEFEEALSQDDQGRVRFEQLSLSKQRFLIGFISKAKTVHTRVNRSVSILNKLQRYPKGKEDLRDVIKSRK
ncbi:YdeI/OmpD-associated family protein [Halocola ammonii]